LGHSEPSQLSLIEQEKVTELTKKALKALKLNNSPSHTEIIITKNGPKIVEIGARLGGDNITTHLVPLSTGIDMVKSVIELALGIPPKIEKKYQMGSAIRYFTFNPGKIKSIDRNPSMFSEQDYVELVFLKKPGEIIDEITDSAHRFGYVICQAEDAKKAVEKCEKISKGIIIKYDEEKNT